MKMEKSKVDTLIAISPNTWHASKFIHISPQDKWICDLWRQQTKATFLPKKSEYAIYGDNKQRPLDQQPQQVISNDTNRSLVFDWLLLMLVFYLSLDCPWWLWLNLIDCVWWLIDCIFYCVFDCLWCLFLIEFLIVFKESIKLFKLVSCFKKTI